MEWSLARCPICEKSHTYVLAITHVAPTEARSRPLVFGGASAATTVILLCPERGKSFSERIHVELPEGQTIARADPITAALAEEPAAGLQWSVESEYQDWIRSSASLLRDYAKTMITVSTGAIPIFFALVSYLGIAHQGRQVWIAVGCSVPILLLAAAVVFVDALRPRGEKLDLESFAGFRTRRLLEIRTRMTAGTVLFVSAVAIASIVSVALLIR
jgi:hypothetical protein